MDGMSAAHADCKEPMDVSAMHARATIARMTPRIMKIHCRLRAPQDQGEDQISLTSLLRGPAIDS
jgi:hypothetical protein